MVESEEVERRRRRRWSVADKRRIVELTLEPGASVALVARAHGVNANQVFVWRRAFERGELAQPVIAATTLLPVLVPDPDKAAIEEFAQPEPPALRGSIHIEFPGLATIRVESGADAVLLRAILESLVK